MTNSRLVAQRIMTGAGTVAVYPDFGKDSNHLAISPLLKISL